MALVEYHAKLSPSSSERWIKCPGSIAAQAAVTEPEKSSNASLDGTAAHSLFQVGLAFGIPPSEMLDKVIDDTKLKIAQHMVDGVQTALDYVDEYVDLHGPKNVVVHSERRVYIGPMIGTTKEICNGTTDVLIEHLDRSRLVIVDYKHGMKVVNAKDNSQMMLYTAGAVHDFGTKFKQYLNVIIQPRAAKRRPVEEHTYKHAQLTMFLKKAEKAAQIALMKDAPRVAGDHCMFCRASNNCDTFRRRARAVAADEFGEVPDPETISAEKIEQVLDEARILRMWIDKVEARALSMAMNDGHKFNGYELGWGTRTRQWLDEQAAADWCATRKLGVDEYSPRAMLTPPALEALLKRKNLYPKKKRSDLTAPESPLAHLIGYSLPNPVLKRVSEPGEDFSALE